MSRRLFMRFVLGLVAVLGLAGPAVAAPATPAGLRATGSGLRVDLDWPDVPTDAVAEAPAAIEPPLRVDGTVLRDHTGRRVGLKGVAVQMVPFYAGATATTRDSFLVQVTDRNFRQRAAEFETLAGLGYNAIRVHIPGPSVYASELYETKGASVARIAAIVAAAKAEGLVTILDSDAIGNAMANWRDYKPIFADVIASVGDDPWIVWEPLNEPADYAAGAPSYLAAVKGIGAHIRSLGSRQPLILPCNEYQQSVSPVLMDDILDDAASRGWRASGLLFGVHPYLDHFRALPGSPGDVFAGAARDALERGIAANLADYPLIVTEMGRYNNAITTTNATREAYQWVAGLGAAGLNGFIAWDWDWALDEQATDPNAWTWDGLHLNPWGRQSHDEAMSKISFPELAGSTTRANAPTYRVYRNDDGGGWRLVGSPSASAFRDEGLSAATEYSYRVTAVDEAGVESEPSEPVVLSSLAAPGGAASPAPGPTTTPSSPEPPRTPDRDAPTVSTPPATVPLAGSQGPAAPNADPGPRQDPTATAVVAPVPAASAGAARTAARASVASPALASGSATIRGGVLHMRLAKKASHVRKVKLTVSGRARRRTVTASRTVTLASGQRTVRWALPRNVVDAPSLSLRAAQTARGGPCALARRTCWTPMARWLAIPTRNAHRQSRS